MATITPHGRTMTTKKKLHSFTEEIKELFNSGQIHSPVHLSLGNEEQLIRLFKKIHPNDWVFSTHRSHYHALLKGVPKEWLREQILDNRSMHINSKEHRFFTSAIVGGICPIALGVALGIKRRGGTEHVWCFVGDMGSETGIFYECTKYACRHDLPVSFVIEDNGFSVNTPTQESWGPKEYGLDGHIQYYEYERLLPHSGSGQWIKF